MQKIAFEILFVESERNSQENKRLLLNSLRRQQAVPLNVTIMPYKSPQT